MVNLHGREVMLSGSLPAKGNEFRGTETLDLVWNSASSRNKNNLVYHGIYSQLRDSLRFWNALCQKKGLQLLSLGKLIKNHLPLLLLRLSRLI